jgi:iron complex transport system permease protein
MRRHLVLRTTRPAASLRLETGTALVLAGTLLAAVTALAIGVAIGDYPLEPSEVVAALIGQGSDAANFIVLELRLPRLFSGLLVGASLGISGAIFQSIARNPLAAPDIIGVMAGASVAVVVALVVVGSATLVLPAALFGGLAAAGLVIGLSWRRGLSGMRLVLVGIGVNAGCLAVVDYLLTRGDVIEVQQVTVWLVGSLSGSGWADVRLLGLTMVVLIPSLAVLARRLEPLRLGDDLATSLGSRIGRDRLLLVVIGVGLAAFAVAVVGPVGFVAFVSPHLARGLSRATGSGALATSALIGAIIVVAADLVARRVAAPIELPVGLFTAIVGAPYLLWLVARGARLGAAS